MLAVSAATLKYL